ncbi:MAG: hypothetical protein D6710_04490 [Nitrospirae bacterium]|nr:MAG: hypothetical protein D6710_04490 [Nitrospirota bacterium]
MKFIVSRRIESIGSDERPCEEAVRESLTPLDYRNVESLEEAKGKIWFDNWLRGGVNHREEQGRVVCERRQKEQRWVVEIGTLEELLLFQSRYGDILIRDSSPYKEVSKEIILP